MHAYTFFYAIFFYCVFVLCDRLFFFYFIVEHNVVFIICRRALSPKRPLAAVSFVRTTNVIHFSLARPNLLPPLRYDIKKYSIVIHNFYLVKKILSFKYNLKEIKIKTLFCELIFRLFGINYFKIDSNKLNENHLEEYRRMLKLISVHRQKK